MKEIWYTSSEFLKRCGMNRHWTYESGGGLAVFIRDNIAATCKKGITTSVESLLFDLHIEQTRL